MGKKKFQKTLHKVCPECQGALMLITDSVEKNGVEYAEQYIECECGYRKKYKTSNKTNIKDEFSKW
jgi:hypothetical protein